MLRDNVLNAYDLQRRPVPIHQFTIRDNRQQVGQLGRPQWCMIFGDLHPHLELRMPQASSYKSWAMGPAKTHGK